MNIAMTLYKQHYYGNLHNTRIDELKGIILMRNDFKSKIMTNGDERVTFIDKSTLIFTCDNVQVSLF